MEGSDFIVMLLVKIIVISKEKLMSNLEEDLINYMTKEMVFDAFNKIGACELLRTQKDNTDKSQYQLVWIEQDKDEFIKFKNLYPMV